MRSNEKPCVCNVFATPQSKNPVKSSFPSYLNVNFSSQRDNRREYENTEKEPFQVDCFDGGIPTVSFGQVVDFNLMLKHGADGKRETAQINPGGSFTLKPEEEENLLAVYVAAGNVKIEDKQVKTGELFICKNWSKERMIENAGESVVGLEICRVFVK